MRLQKFLSRAGVASRRKSEILIQAGRVRVDGAVVTERGTSVDPETQRVEVDRELVQLKPAEWLALHKPPGYASTRSDPGKRPTIYDLLPERSHHLFHVGRLDFMSEGLLLMSNEGDLVHRLLHPSMGLRRVYVVTLVGPAPDDIPARLTAGVVLEDGPAAAQSSRWLSRPAVKAPRLEIALAEGRNREIRRMLAALDLKIRRLSRVAFGPVELGSLASGDARELSTRERRSLERAVR